MKKMLILACMAIGIVACGKEENNGATSGPVQNSPLTPGQHQQKLEDIALEFVDLFNTNDTKEIIDALNELERCFYYADFPEYSFELLNAMSQAANFSVDGLAKFMTRALYYDYVLDLNDRDMNPLAGNSYTFNDYTYEWDIDRVDSNSVILNWSNASAKISWTSSNYRWTWDNVYDEERYTAYIPLSMEFVLMIDGKQQAKIVIVTNVTNETTMSPEATLYLNGKYVFTVTTTLTEQSIGAQATISVNNSLVAVAQSSVAIYGLTNPDNWIYEDTYTWTDGYGNKHTESWVELDPFSYVYDYVKTGEARLSILDLAIIAQGDFRMVKDEIEEYNDDSERSCDNLCNAINSNSSAVLYYNSTQEKVADIKAQTVEYNGYYSDYYDVEPVVVFPDGSKYAFEGYFSDNKFSALIDTVEDLINWYDRMIG